MTENLHTGLEAFLAEVKCWVGLNKPEMYEYHFEFFPPTAVQSLKPCFHAITWFFIKKTGKVNDTVKPHKNMDTKGAIESVRMNGVFVWNGSCY